MAYYRNVYPADRQVAPARVSAERLVYQTITTCEDGRRGTFGKPGDYLVTFPDGTQGIVTKESFEIVYRLDEDQSAHAVRVPVHVDIHVGPRR